MTSEEDSISMQSDYSVQSMLSESESSEGETQNFDIRLPVNHLYLQSNELGEISSEMFEFLEPGNEITVPLIAKEVVLLPGQSLPLNFIHNLSIKFIRKRTKKHSYFCLATMNPYINFFDYSETNYLSSLIGTLFQVGYFLKFF